MSPAETIYDCFIDVDRIKHRDIRRRGGSATIGSVSLLIQIKNVSGVTQRNVELQQDATISPVETTRTRHRFSTQV